MPNKHWFCLPQTQAKFAWRSRAIKEPYTGNFLRQCREASVYLQWFCLDSILNIQDLDEGKFGQFKKNGLV